MGSLARVEECLKVLLRQLLELVRVLPLELVQVVRLEVGLIRCLLLCESNGQEGLVLVD